MALQIDARPLFPMLFHVKLIPQVCFGQRQMPDGTGRSIASVRASAGFVPPSGHISSAPTNGSDRMGTSKPASLRSPEFVEFYGRWVRCHEHGRGWKVRLRQAEDRTGHVSRETVPTPQRRRPASYVPCHGPGPRPEDRSCPPRRRSRPGMACPDIRGPQLELGRAAFGLGLQGPQGRVRAVGLADALAVNPEGSEYLNVGAHPRI